MANWLGTTTSDNIQLGWVNSGGTNYFEQYQSATDASLFAGQEDAINAWMWRHHPLRAYFKISTMGQTAFVSGKQSLIALAVASGALYFIVIK